MLNISVIIPVYNAAAFLEKAVDSALRLQEVKEIILIDDQSLDNSLEICRKLAAENPGIKVLQHADGGNHGAGATRNLGISKASCDFIAFLDADDYYLDNRFDAEKIIFNDTETEGIFGALGTDFITEKGRAEFQEKFKNNNLTTVRYAAGGKNVFEGLMGLSDKNFGTFFHLNTLTVKKDSIKRNNIFFNEDLRVHQDSDFIIKLSYHCHLRTGIIDKAIAIRGVHDDNRITKIKLYTEKYYHNHFLLQKSLYQWAKEKKIPPKYFQKINLDFLAFQIAGKKGFKKYLCYLKAVLSYPELLKTRYRFHALNPYAADEKN